jgi:hypothetical protein
MRTDQSVLSRKADGVYCENLKQNPPKKNLCERKLQLFFPDCKKVNKYPLDWKLVRQSDFEKSCCQSISFIKIGASESRTLLTEVNGVSHVFYYISHRIWTKFGTEGAHRKLFSKGEPRANLDTKSQTSPMCANEFLPALCTLIVRFGENLVWEIRTRSCWVFTSFTKIDTGKGREFLRDVNQITFTPVPWNRDVLTSNVRLGKVRVLNHRKGNLQSCLTWMPYYNTLTTVLSRVNTFHMHADTYEYVCNILHAENTQAPTELWD